MIDIKDLFSEGVTYFRKYAYEFGQYGDTDTYDLMINEQVNLHKIFDDELSRLNNIISELQQDANRYRFMRNTTSIMTFEKQTWVTSHKLDMRIDEAMRMAVERPMICTNCHRDVDNDELLEYNTNTRWTDLPLSEVKLISMTRKPMPDNWMENLSKSGEK